MVTDPASLGSRVSARRRLGVAGLIVLCLVLSVFAVGRVSAAGQPSFGFSEAAGGEQFQVMGPNYTVRTNLAFLDTETVRVNVTSTVVDWLGNAGGGGATDLLLLRYDGSTVMTVAFSQTNLGPTHVYSASIGLAPLTLAPDAYFLRIFIDDTRNTFEATSEIFVGSAQPHFIETYTDHTFAHPSDVFTSTSVVWVKVVGNPNGDGDRWDIADFLNGMSAVGGAQGGFANFRRAGDTYTFSIDLSRFGLVNGWSYTLSVRLTNGAFDAGKQIQSFDPTLTVAPTDIAPPTARQGQTDVPLLALDLSLNANWGQTLGPAAFNLERVRVTLTGSGAGSDVAGVKVWDDVNGNRALDAGDVLLASTSNLGGLAFPVWVGTTGVGMTTVESIGPRHLLITYDISPTATVGVTVGARIPGAADVNMAGRFVSLNGLPAQSSNVQITAAIVLSVTNDPGIAPGTAIRGQTAVTVDLLTFSTNGAAIVVDNISVDFAGTGVRSDVLSVSLHVDNGDGVYNPTTDVLLGTAMAFPGTGPAVFRNLNFAVDAAGRSIWIVYDLSSSAVIGDRVGSSLASNASVQVRSGSVFGGTFPLNSGLVTIVGPTLTVSWTNLAPAQARQGRANVPMLKLTLSLDSGQGTVAGMRIDKRGTSTLDSDVLLAKIWLDDGDGLFGLGDTLLGQQAFVGGTTVIGFTLGVTVGTNRVLFVTYDIGPTATLGATVSARFANPAYVSADPNTTVAGANFPIQSSAATIVAGGPGAIVSVGGVDLAARTPQVNRGQTGVAMEKLVLTADANQATVSGIRVDKRGTSTLDSDLAAVKLYRDANGDGNLTSADTLLGSTTFVAGTAIFGSLNVVVTATQPVILFVVIDISLTGTVGATIDLRLANSNYIAVDVNSTIESASFPIRSSDVTILAQPLGTISGTVSDAAGNPIANASVEIPQLGLTTTTNAQGAYAFMNVPMGTYYVIARHPGYADTNQTVSLTTANPMKVVNFTLSPISAGGVNTTLLYIGAGLAALLVLAGLLFLFVRRKSRCPVCGKAKASDQEVCPECMAKGLHPPGSAPPGGPPGQPPMQPPWPPAPPSPPGDDL